MSTLPLIPTMGVGSYAAPGWFIAARGMMRDGAFGEQDIEEALDDATRVVIADQVEAGVDILTDGELRRQRFVYEMYDRIEGLRRIPPVRKLGIPGYDRAPSFVAVDRLSAPAGFGLVEDFEALRRMTGDRPVKIAMPGPLTFAGNVACDGRPSEAELIDQIVGLVRTELTALTDAGADYIQLDEPALPRTPYGLGPEDAAAVINRTLEGIPGRLAVHVCFGNNAGRPFADRRMDRLQSAMQNLRCDQLVLEYANRQMADVELLGDLAATFDIAAGVVDVKNFHLETADDVARRLDRCLQFVPEERLTATADCGFSALPRYLARQKLGVMVEGAKLVRGRR